MATRSIFVALSANVEGFVREMGRARAELDKLVEKQGHGEKVASSLSGRLLQSAKHQSETWRTVGAAALTTGAALTGVAASVAKTGIEYNTLQQASRAAMRTLMGDAQAANQQMDKLDKFAKTSPFAKQVFIKAQQQMIGFGIEAKKVLPYLEAIQDAVAATGGSNNDIAELAYIFAKVQGQAKLTAVNLKEFGLRGVDAAGIIAQAMGKTGAELRAAMKKGTIDAEAALDALAKGMKTKFGGAAAGVKETFVGATDRVKAAFRDLSASIMETAVSKDGGGWLIDLTNGVADFIRAIDALPGPVKTTIGIVTALSGALLTTSGAVMLALPKFLQIRSALATMGSIAPRATGVLVGIGKAAGPIGLAVSAVAGLTGALIASREEALRTKLELDKMGEKLAGLASNPKNNPNNLLRHASGKFAKLPFKQGEIDSWGKALDIINDPQKYQGKRPVGPGSMQSVWGNVDEIKRQFKEVEKSLKGLDEVTAKTAFAKIADDMRKFGHSTEAILGAFPEYIEKVQGAAQAQLGFRLSNEELLTVLRQGTIVIKDQAGGFHTWSYAMDEAQTKQSQMSEQAARSQQTLSELREQYGDMSVKSEMVNNALTRLTESVSIESLTEKELHSVVEKTIKEYDDLFNSVANARAGFVDLTGTIAKHTQNGRMNLQSYLADLDKQIKAQQQWSQNLQFLAAHTSQNVVNHLANMGTKGAALVQALADDVVKNGGGGLKRFSSLVGQELGAANQAGTEAIINAGNVWSALMKQSGAKTVAELANQVRTGRTSIEQIISNSKLNFNIGANTNSAINSARNAVSRISQMQAYVKIGSYMREMFTGRKDGGILEYYARGGLRERHVAQIAPAGTWRVWAEPETGGEAYIPLHPSKRARSMEIWREVGRRFGAEFFAGGGVQPPRRGYRQPAPQQFHPGFSRVERGGSPQVVINSTINNPVATPYTIQAQNQLARTAWEGVAL